MIKNSPLSFGKISLLLALLAWVALVIVDLVRIFAQINNLDSGIAEEVTWGLELLFFICLFLLYRYNF